MPIINQPGAPSGGSLPSQWTVGPHGELTIDLSAEGGGITPLTIIVPDTVSDFQDLIKVKISSGAQVAAIIDSAGEFESLVGTTGSYSMSGRVIKESTQYAAPADGDLAGGELVLWFDNTGGAAKLMVKAKDANGSVVTGQVALA